MVCYKGELYVVLLEAEARIGLDRLCGVNPKSGKTIERKLQLLADQGPKYPSFETHEWKGGDQLFVGYLLNRSPAAPRFKFRYAGNVANRETIIIEEIINHY